jgi:uncharacterized protein YceH (UPF0502 family)
MSNYHGQIMNLPVSQVTFSLCNNAKEQSAYMAGHRDARHAAAELAIQADQRIDELEAKVIELQEICDSRFDEINRLRFGSR